MLREGRPRREGVKLKEGGGRPGGEGVKKNHMEAIRENNLFDLILRALFLSKRLD